MRTKHMFLALTMAAACGVEGPVLYSEDAGLGGSTSGSGGAVVGTGGIAAGSGGAVVATGGLAVGSGGAVAGSGGAVLATGGIAVGSGGVVLGTGGSSVGRGGAAGSSVGRGGAVATGGVVIGSGGAVLATGGIGSGGGGAVGGRGGSGGNPDASDRCSGYTNSADCRKNNCMSVDGVLDGVSEITTFFECISSTCTGVMTAAYPPGQPANCYVFFSGCIPDGWTPIGGSNCPIGSLKPTITSLKVTQDCMPGPAVGDKLSITFDVKYDNAGQSRASAATITSATLTYADTSTVAVAVTPTYSGVVPAGESVSVTHKNDPDTKSGIGCVCGSTTSSVTLNVTWQTGGQIGPETVTSSLAASPSCGY